MRKPAYSKARRGRPVARPIPISAPVKGWNALDAIGNMDPDYALNMTNYFPETNDVRLREGVVDHATGFGSAVESLMNYAAEDGTEELYAAAGANIYDITTNGAIGAAVVSGQTSAQYQYINFANSSGTSYLCCFNGEDAPQYYNGSAWITITGVSSPALTGITPADVVDATVHVRRMWLVLKDSITPYYLAIDSVGGAATAFNLAGYMSKGGYIMAAETWTLDAGEGAEDYLVFVSSEGQVAVFRGTDPSQDTTWALSGVWNIGEPIGRRCMIKYRGDCLITCVDGVYPLSAALVSSQTNPEVALTFKISKAMTDAARLYKDTFGWQLLHYPAANMLLLNVPKGAVAEHEQFAMNTITRAWGGPFKGVPAICWTIHKGEPYYGTTAEVGRFWGTFDDNGDEIEGEIQFAYSYLRSGGRLSNVNAMRVNVLSSGNPSMLVGLNTDFQDNALDGALTFQSVTESLWDQVNWDEGDWGGSLRLLNGWQTVFAIGTAISPRLKSSTAGIELRLQSIDLLTETGGVIA